MAGPRTRAPEMNMTSAQVFFEALRGRGYLEQECFAIMNLIELRRLSERPLFTASRVLGFPPYYEVALEAAPSRRVSAAVRDILRHWNEFVPNKERIFELTQYEARELAVYAREVSPPGRAVPRRE